MSERRIWLVALVLAASVAGAQGTGSSRVEREIDPGLARLIAATKAFDDHAHPVLPPPNDKTDRGFDALPVDNMEAETDTVAWRTDNPQLPAAWKALWGFEGLAPLDAAGMQRLEAARAVVKAREGARFDAWVLDQAGIGTQVANRTALGAGVAEPRFRWVPYADALLFPLNNAGLAEAHPDRKLFFPLEDKLRAKYLADAGVAAMPATLAEYLSKVVTPTLERQKAGGAIAEKFEVAYLRGFGFANVPRAEAEQAYAAGLAAGDKPNAGQYRRLQDFLFRYIALECGRLGMAVHLHTMAGGGGYFGINGDNPLLLEPLFNDPKLRGTKFVMLHGGWPFVREAGALLQKPNVYLDLSQETLTFSPRTLAGWLREWLETYPEKVLFGTDGYPYSDAMGWEESTWMAARNGREALGLAVSGMLEDGEISRARAEAIVVGVMKGNAAAVYGK